MVAEVVAGPVVDPVSAAVEVIEGALDGLSCEVWAGLDAVTVRGLVSRVARLRNRLDAHALAAARVLEGTDVARREGAVSTGELLGRDLGNDRAAGVRLVSAARQVRPRSATEEALTRGELNLGQARIIATGLKNLPADTTVEQRELAERALVKDAGVYSPRDLRARADRIADQWADKTTVDRHESALLVEREHVARAKTELRMWGNGDGTTSGRFTVPDAQAGMLKTVLDGYASPRRASMVRRQTHQDYHRRLGHGFCELIERIPTDGLPNHGGNTVTVTVNMNLTDLESRLDEAGPATLVGENVRLSPGQVRRLVCTAKLLPQVFDGDSLPLDLGRKQRLFTNHQRRALTNRDQGCTFPGCDRPPSWCETHHARESWASGGATDLRDGVLLCCAHHHQVHDERYDIRFHPDDEIPEYRHPRSTHWKRNTRYQPPRE